MMNRFLRLPTVKEYTGLSRSSIYLMIAEKQFPKPIKLGERAVAWLENDIEAWMSKRIKASNQVARGA